MNNTIYNLCDDDKPYHGFSNGEKWNGFTKIWVNDDGLNELCNNPDIEYYPYGDDEIEKYGEEPIMMNRQNFELFGIRRDDTNNLYLLDAWTTSADFQLLK